MSGTTKSIAASALVGILLIAQPALAADGSFTGQFGALAVGKVQALERPDHIFWSGAFSGTFFDDKGKGLIHRAWVTCPGSNTIDMAANTSKAGGYCVISDGADSKIYLTWECAGTPSGCKGTGDWISGTGKWKGVKGKATFEAGFGPILSDGTEPTWASWDVTYSMP